MAKQWITPQGTEIPEKFVPQLDKKKDRFAEKMLKEAKIISKKLEDFKHKLMEGGDDLWLAMQEAENVRTGKKGYSITSFDKSIKIEVNQSERIEFDDQVEIAKALINQYLDEKLSDTDSELKAIVHHAFETRSGQLDTKRVIGLFRLKINHEKWIRAMEIIKKSMSANVSKRYASILEKDANGEYKDIKLNFSAI